VPFRSVGAFRVLLVSTRNSTCAAIAERLLRPSLADTGIEAWAIRVTSAGLEDESGSYFHPNAEFILRSLGGNPGGFRSRYLEHDHIDDADLILTMTVAERDAVVERYPRARQRAFTLVEYARLNDLVQPIAPLREHPLMLAPARFQVELTDEDDISAPADLSPRGFNATATVIAEAISHLAGHWIAMAPAIGPHRDPLGAARLLDRGADKELVRLQVFGVPVDVRCTGDGGRKLSRVLHAAWSRCLRPEGEGDEEAIFIEAIVHDDATELKVARARGALGGETIGDLMHALAGAVTVRAIDERAGSVIMLHAAGLALPDGRVVAFVAPSGTGKTTLSRTLGKHFGYVSDETVVIELDGSVIPYPKPLSVITTSPHANKEQYGPDDEGLLIAPDDLRLARIVLLNRVGEPGSEPVVEDVELLPGIAELAAQVSYLPRLAEPLRSMARAIERTGGLQRVTYCESASLANLVEEFAGGAA
jgi:protein-tyrosine-phosphatase